MKWEVFAPVKELFVGLELDFMEHPEISDEPQPQLSVGDDVMLELHGAGKWLKGSVTQSTNAEVVVDFDGERWRLGPRQSDDIYNPVKTQMRLRIWYTRQKL